MDSAHIIIDGISTEATDTAMSETAHTLLVEPFGDEYGCDNKNLRGSDQLPVPGYFTSFKQFFNFIRRLGIRCCRDTNCQDKKKNLETVAPKYECSDLRSWALVVASCSSFKPIGPALQAARGACTIFYGCLVIEPKLNKALRSLGNDGFAIWQLLSWAMPGRGWEDGGKRVWGGRETELPQICDAINWRHVCVTAGDVCVAAGAGTPLAAEDGVDIGLKLGLSTPHMEPGFRKQEMAYRFARNSVFFKENVYLYCNIRLFAQ